MGKFVGLMHFQAPPRVGVGVWPLPQLTQLLNSRTDHCHFTQQSILQTLTSALLKSLEMLLLRRLLPHCVRCQTAHHSRPLVDSDCKQTVPIIRPILDYHHSPIRCTVGAAPWDSSCPLVAIRAPPRKPVFSCDELLP